MEMKLGVRIASLRKARGMTQEALARAVGVSAPAVSKWETDASCPDIALLCPLARALGINVDTLLAFEPAITAAQIAEVMESVVSLARTGDSAQVEKRLDDALHTFPSSTALKLNVAAAMDVLALNFPDAPQEKRDAWTARKRALYEEVHRTGTEREREAAACALAALELACGALDRAQALLQEIPTHTEDTTMLRVQLHQKRGEPEAALTAVQERLYRLITQVQSCLQLLGMDLEADPQRGLEIARVYDQVEALFGVGGGMGAGAMLQQYLRMGDKQEALACLTRLTQTVTGPLQPPRALLFAPTIVPTEGKPGMQRELRRMMLRGLEADTAFDPLRAEPAFAQAMERIRESLAQEQD